MNHPLPARPSFVPSSSSSLPIAGPSKVTTLNLSITPKSPVNNTKCTICSIPPKYTCPRCSKRTCSLECSKKHKIKDECNGIRDPTAFVPLNQYSQGAWSDDYKWLEEGRRKVTNWGEDVKIDEIQKSKSNPNLNNQKLIKNKIRPAIKKAWKLKLELNKLGCDVDFLPSGMEKKKLNQSNWNAKSHQVYITLHINIPSALLEKKPASCNVKTIVHPRVLFSTSDTAKSNPSPTLLSLTNIPLTSTKVVHVLPFYSTPTRPAPEHTQGQKLFYPPLDSSKPLPEVLKGTSWVEFPVIEVLDRIEWDEGLKNGVIVIVPLSEPVIAGRNVARTRDNGWGKRKVDSIDNGQNDDTSTKVKEVDTKKPKVNIEGLMALGDYDSESEDEAGEIGESGEEIEDQVPLGEDVDAMGQAEEDNEIGDEPSVEVLQAVGMALAADLGEA
ncbi:uncharacterized protein I206_100451 [Kwoniella pini CBS 10737]|uniref:HIT-type domain-containing protein n=1 Tax=Kwoniella pini CBS 10737 TaxID=1296096 RepID=A0A1B9IDI1_9TREE|nr:uncharacterized protein I206_00878 [Kwoniella pini CBS 10737]OCF53573.1 hypothetical protein I206_00878 [Kwoniella pini CBS 10737]